MKVNLDLGVKKQLDEFYIIYFSNGLRVNNEH